METWWGRHGETVWATLAAIIIALIFGYYFFRKSEKSRDLGYENTVKQPIISIHGNETLLASMKLEVLFNDQLVESPNIVIVRLRNVGKRAIEKSQLTGGVVFQFLKAKVLQVSLSMFEGGITSSEVSSVTDAVTGSIAVYPTLMNPGDASNLIFITNGELDFPVVTSRIVEGRLLNLTESSNRRNKTATRILLIGTPLVMVSLLVVALVFGSDKGGQVWLFLISAGGGAGIPALAFWAGRKRI